MKRIFDVLFHRRKDGSFPKQEITEAFVYSLVNSDKMDLFISPVKFLTYNRASVCGQLALDMYLENNSDSVHVEVRRITPEHDLFKYLPFAKASV